MFDAVNGELSVIWYPGRHNTLTMNGKIGEQAKQHLINSNESSILDGSESVENRQGSRVDIRESIENLSLKLDVLRSRVDSLQSLDESLIRTSDLSDKMPHHVLSLDATSFESQLKKYVNKHRGCQRPIRGKRTSSLYRI